MLPQETHFTQIVPDKSQKRKVMMSDPYGSQQKSEISSPSVDENLCLSERDFEDISNKIENRISKRLSVTEFGQRETLRLIENLSSKVDNLSNASSEQSCSKIRPEPNIVVTEEIEETDLTRNAKFFYVKRTSFRPNSPVLTST